MAISDLIEKMEKSARSTKIAWGAAAISFCFLGVIVWMYIGNETSDEPALVAGPPPSPRIIYITTTPSPTPTPGPPTPTPVPPTHTPTPTLTPTPVAVALGADATEEEMYETGIYFHLRGDNMVIRTTDESGKSSSLRSLTVDGETLADYLASAYKITAEQRETNETTSRLALAFGDRQQAKLFFDWKDALAESVSNGVDQDDLDGMQESFLPLFER